jgi:acyl carrier protein
MQYSHSPEQNCARFKFGLAACRNRALAGHTFCEYHYGPLTPENARSRVIEFVSDEMGLDFEEVFEETRIEDEGDSLLVVEVIVRLEEEFDILIPDQEADRLQSVRDFVNYVTNYLQEKKPTTHSAATLSYGKEREDQHTERILNRVILSKLFCQYYEVLELDEGEIVRLFRQVIGNRRIYHVTPVIAYKDEEKQELECIHLFLLGKHNLFYFRLSSRSVKFEWTSLKDLRLTYKVSLNDKKKISLITVESLSEARPSDKSRHAVDNEKLDSEENLHNVAFDFEGDEIDGALEFLNKYLANLEDAE